MHYLSHVLVNDSQPPRLLYASSSKVPCCCFDSIIGFITQFGCIKKLNCLKKEEWTQPTADLAPKGLPVQKSSWSLRSHWRWGLGKVPCQKHWLPLLSHRTGPAVAPACQGDLERSFLKVREQLILHDQLLLFTLLPHQDRAPLC